MLRLAGIAAKLGIRKVRVTGGVPLVRRGVVDFLQNLHRVPGIEEVCLTTNGVLLADLAPALYETGLRHLNLSLDTLHRERYREITGKDNLGEVLSGSVPKIFQWLEHKEEGQPFIPTGFPTSRMIAVPGGGARHQNHPFCYKDHMHIYLLSLRS